MANPQYPLSKRPITSPGRYSFGSPGGVMRTEVAGGHNRYALEWDRGVVRYQVNLLLTETQFLVWELFYLRTIKKGAITFDMPITSGAGISNHACNIVPGSYNVSVQAGGVTWSVAFEVEAEPDLYQFDDEDAANMADLYAEYGEGLDDILDRLAIFANQDSDVLDF